MKKKYIALILIVLTALVVAVGAYFYYHVDYTSTQLSDSCAIDMPKSDNVLNKTINNMTAFNDTDHKVSILYYNSYDSGLAESIAKALVYKGYFESYKTGAVDITSNESQFVNKANNDSMWYNKEDKYYMASVGNSTTHDNILIVSERKDIIEHMLSSINYTKTNTNENN
jgi:hypothetical protein